MSLVGSLNENDSWPRPHFFLTKGIKLSVEVFWFEKKSYFVSTKNVSALESSNSFPKLDVASIKNIKLEFYMSAIEGTECLFTMEMGTGSLNVIII